MSSDLRVTLLQTPLYEQQVSANLAMLEEKLWDLDEQTDLVVLPEMFNTGFTMNAQAVAEPMNLYTFKWMKQMASQLGAVVTGSFAVSERGRFYNRLIWMRPDGTFEQYDKRHLFRMAGEDEVYTPGNQRLITQIRDWNICPLICYDLRFPVWSRNAGNAFDLLIYVANWPETRITAWDVLLQARAIENLCYVAGLNRTGNGADTSNGLVYNGHSGLFEPQGHAIFMGGTEKCQTFVLNKEALIAFRAGFPAYKDADRFDIQL